jgi:UDP-N-acetylglucosamine diphosphorylase / glucose-1-phosphate thymidylyltransferase / UDP-N-acetylgalactosamine diphosphorylase / glucosamine-1-phosphate N-acetyltransferase / galactosamine-1-phosphate N-acetyltransferase
MAERTVSYVLETGRTISPFGDRPGEVRVLNRSLAERQREACEPCGVEAPRSVSDPGEITAFPCVVFADHTWFTRTLLEEFLAGARAEGGSRRCAIGASVFVEATESLQDLDRLPDGAAAYDLWYLTAAVDTPSALADLPVVTIDPKETVEEPRLPPQFVNEATPSRVAVTSRGAMHVTHWALIVRVNLAAFVSTLKDLWERRPVYIVLRVVFDRLLGRFRRVRLSRVGKGCEIHPTAVVEGSWLGDNVKVGAGAVIQGCVIGNDAIVEEAAILELTTLGHRTWIGRNTVVFMSVMYDGVFSGHRLTQACLFGHEVCTTGGGYLIDMNFHGPVKVMKDGKPVSAGTNFLGVCIGHRVTMGTGLWIHAGREVPNDTFMIRDPADVLMKIPSEVEPGQPMMLEHGALVPFER